MIESFLILFIVVGLIIGLSRRPKNFPPGPRGLPLLGIYHKIDKENSERTWAQYYKKWGPVVGFYAGTFKICLLSGWDAVREVLTNEDCNGRPDVCLLRDRFEGNLYGVAFTDGDEWKVQRRFALHHFRNLGFGRKSHESVVLTEATEFVKILREYGSQPVDLENLITMAQVNVIWSLFVGCRYSFTDSRLQELADNVQEHMSHIKPYGSIASMVPFMRYLFPNSTGYNAIRRSSDAMRRFIRPIINDHRASFEPGNPRDFIDVYLEELSKNNQEQPLHPSFSEKQLEGICIDLLCAGVDTSSSTLRFTLFFLCTRPDLQIRLRDEILAVIGTERLPCLDDKTKLVWCQAFMMEVLRFRPPGTSTLPHRAMKDTTLGEYDIPRDTILFIALHSSLMEVDYWGDPHVFRPQRFVSLDGKLQMQERLLIFGKGKRKCLGESVAKMTHFLMMATLLQNFSFAFPLQDEIPSDEGLQNFVLKPLPFRVVATPL